MFVWGSSVFHYQLGIAFTAHCRSTTVMSGVHCVQPQSHTKPKDQLSVRSAPGTWGGCERRTSFWFYSSCHTVSSNCSSWTSRFISFSLVKHIWNLVTYESLWNPVNVAIIVEYQCQQIIKSVTAKHGNLHFFLLSLRCEHSPFMSYLRLQLPHFVLADMFNSLGCTVLNR